MLTIKLPDGNNLSFESKVTGIQVAEKISKSLSKQALIMSVDGELKDLNYLLELSIKAACEASEEILKIYNGVNFDVDKKQDGSPITLADKNANKVIEKILSKTNIPILSEEGNDIIPSCSIILQTSPSSNNLIYKHGRQCFYLIFIYTTKRMLAYSNWQSFHTESFTF